MSIERLLTSAFPNGSRTRGQEYFLQGRAKILARTDSKVELAVRGEEKYDVSIEHRPTANTVQLQCDCPYFEGGNLCKHLWAGLLVVDHEGLLRDLAKAHEITIDYGGYTEDVEDLSEVPGADEYEDDSLLEPKALHSGAPAWQLALERAERKSQVPSLYPSARRASVPKLAHYGIDLDQSRARGQIFVQIFQQEQLRSGTWGAVKRADLSHQSVAEFAERSDRDVLAKLLGRTEVSTEMGGYFGRARGISGVGLAPQYAGELLAEISATGRMHLLESQSYYYKHDKFEPQPLTYSTSPWTLELELKKAGSNYSLEGEILRGEERRHPRDVRAQVGSFLFFENEIAPIFPSGSNVWFTLLNERKSLEIPVKDVNSFFEYFFTPSQSITLRLPDEIKLSEITDLRPRGRLALMREARGSRLRVERQLVYGERVIPLDFESASIVDILHRQRIWRDLATEKEIRDSLGDLDPMLSANALVEFTDKAFTQGWEVFIQESRLHKASNFELKVASGVDWFELQGDVSFNGQKVTLPELLKAMREDTRMIRLQDGSMGVMPEDWIQKLRLYANMGEMDGEGIRLNRIQALFLSASLDDNANLQPDKRFSTLRGVLESVRSLKPMNAAGLTGVLRPYQKQGLGWLTALAQHNLGGILADDMGLGKTIQILALLSAKERRGRPSLIVAPKSLVFNWLNEAAKFTPQLKFLNYSGPNRPLLDDSLSGADVVLTTYQTLRADVDRLKKFKFDIFVMDEAHYIKNPKSQAAMACRLVSADQKFCLTGTPVENSLNDLFSILSVANPGLISADQARKWSAIRDSETLSGLARALSPFLLRRTKEQVLKDLPEKSEQILYCEFSPAEKKKYDELKAYYWSQLSGKFEQKGLARSKIEVLEALLRLRQAACHQGLLDKKNPTATSAKFELLLEQIGSVVRDGHKALIFSQFTSLLALLVPRLREAGVSFEYLDGQTKDREARVQRFQNDPEVKLFLLSLKAGGVGLNLTAADYVFVLDPWWNPAAESQAIDRAHRIGQTKKVFAYKLITKDTVEEKILELQKTKKELAAAIVSEKASLFKDLQMKDLEALFS